MEDSLFRFSLAMILPALTECQETTTSREVTRQADISKLTRTVGRNCRNGRGVPEVVDCSWPGSGTRLALDDSPWVPWNRPLTFCLSPERSRKRSSGLGRLRHGPTDAGAAASSSASSSREATAPA